MRLSNNSLSLFILFFILIAVIGNLSVWLRVTGYLPSPAVTQGRISLCIDSPPVLVTIGNKTANASEAFTYQINITNPVSNTVYYYFNSTPVFSSFNLTNTTGLINFTPSLSELGNYTITFRVTHDICLNVQDSETINFEVGSPNRFPFWTNYTRNFNATEDIPFFINFTTFVSDPDNDSMNFSHNATASSFPAFNLTAAGILNFTANDSSVKNHSVNITVRDTKSASNSSIFIFKVSNVNDAPLLVAIPDLQACEDTAFSYDVNATDEDLLIPNTDEVLHFFDNISLFVINEDTGIISFTPTVSNVANHSIRIFVTDEELADSSDIRLSVIGVNDAPIKSNIGTHTVRINQSFYFDVSSTDEEDTSESTKKLQYNLTFISGGNNSNKFFDINNDTGVMNFTANSSVLGNYTVTVCVNDSGISSQHPNATSYCNDSRPRHSCENWSLTVLNENSPPNITEFAPNNTNLTVNEGDAVIFNVTAIDPDGTTLTIAWIRNGTVVRITSANSDLFTFATDYESAGVYNMTVNASDGELADNQSWNLTVIDVPVIPAGGGGGGGGGGGRSCLELWICEDWNACQSSSTPSSQGILGTLYPKVLANCSQNIIPIENCGFQTRGCADRSKCGTEFVKPSYLQVCHFSTSPSCFDNARNCHDGQCEILVDCGGTCKSCPTCSDKIQNQGESGVDCGGPCPACPVLFPLAGKCGDNKCEISEILTCRDCRFFWMLILFAIIMFLVILRLGYGELKKRKESKLLAGRRKRVSDVQRLVHLSEEAVKNRNQELAKSFYNEAKKAYEYLEKDDKSKFYRKLIQLYTGIDNLARER